MSKKELMHRINREMVDHFREHGKNPNILSLGKYEWSIFNTTKKTNEFDSDDSYIWDMRVSVSDEDTLVEVSWDESIAEDKPEKISEYVIRVAIDVPEGFIKCFQSFIQVQVKDSNMVRVSVWNKDRAFSIRIGGLDKDDVNTFGKDVSNLWDMYVCIINDMFKGDVAWFDEMKSLKEN